MAVTLVATAGATNANSYATLEEANAYMDTRLHKSNWQNAGAEDKKRALIWATRLLDEQVDWNGYQMYSEQALRWPRDVVYDLDGDTIDSETIPQFLKNATAEYAMFLIGEDRTLESNRDMTGLRRVRIDTIEIEASRSSTVVSKPVMPPSVWSIIKFYGKQFKQKRGLVRV